MAQDSNRELDKMKIPIPKGGIRIKVEDDEGKDWIFVLNKLNRPAYALAKSAMSQPSKSLEIAIGIINTLKVEGSDDPNKIEDVMTLAGVEQALADWIQPKEAEVKKS